MKYKHLPSKPMRLYTTIIIFALGFLAYACGDSNDEQKDPGITDNPDPVVPDNPDEPSGQETLYNGIVLPDVWPPTNMDINSYAPMSVSYLDNPPKVVPINVGRQLFVDNFLIESTDLERKFYKPQKYAGNPILKPETALELGPKSGIPGASAKDGGVWW